MLLTISRRSSAVSALVKSLLPSSQIALYSLSSVLHFDRRRGGYTPKFGNARRRYDGDAPLYMRRAENGRVQRAVYVDDDEEGPRGVHTEWKTQSPRDPEREKQLFKRTYGSTSFDRYADTKVVVKGVAEPTHWETVDELQIHPFLLENVKRCGYAALTPVQKYALPAAIDGRHDLMVCAETGSGKTAAFLLPVLHRILQSEPQGQQAKSKLSVCVATPSALVLAPTRELSRQIFDEAQKLAYRTAAIVRVLHGGSENYQRQLESLKDGCHLLVATPGRLMDLVEKGLVDLSQCGTLVLDEADRMLDMGFEPQVRGIVEAQPPKTERYTAMYSATFPAEIQKLAEQFLRPRFLRVEVGRLGVPCANVRQEFFEARSAGEKLEKLSDFLAEAFARADESKQKRILIFTNTKVFANRLRDSLARANYAAEAIHGDNSQNSRERSLRAFRNGHAQILVATEVAARGIDIPDVTSVINYDFPMHVDDYVHRVGRTGRLGNVGHALSFVDENVGSSVARDLVELLAQSNQTVPACLREIAEAGRAGRERRRAGFAHAFGARRRSV